ncbi:BLOC-3 complex member HPS4 [Antennarius striatus]|uniref:BLOC-3 complex member HPS4 n=1 Tax=Antennarius striatus TaxID=241820 RepID=UPI0035AE5E7E
MADQMPPESRGGRCSYFFLYDASKVKDEGDLTREGICYFHPEETPLDRQELICGQLAGVGRCVSELSFSPVRTLKLCRHRFAVRMKDDFFWALGCSAEVPTHRMCELLDQLIDLFCFYHGPVRRSYQLDGRQVLAPRWAKYLSHLQSGASDLQRVFTCLKTVDSTNVDPLLLLKAALILQACQRCPLVLAGCILFKGRVVSTQMVPELTMKVMFHESETYSERPSSGSSSFDSDSASFDNGSAPFRSVVSSTTVFLTTAELRFLQAAPVDKDFRSHSTPRKDTPPTKTRLSRTLSDMPSTESEPSVPGSSESPQKKVPDLLDDSAFSPVPSRTAAAPPVPQTPSLEPPLSNGEPSHGAEEEVLDESYYHSFHSDGSRDNQAPPKGGASAFRDNCVLQGRAGEVDSGKLYDLRRPGNGLPHSGGPEEDEQSPLVPMTLYLHRVRGLVLALLVDPPFMSDAASMEDVYHCSLASLNGLEAHLRTVPPGAPGVPGPYFFAHFDCIQSTMTANLSGRPGGGPERPFVKATSLLHSHFCNTETLQEAIIRSAGAAVYGTRSVAQETFFQQHGGSLRNSGVPNHQDSAFSLPSKARHRLLKHGVNLL